MLVVVSLLSYLGVAALFHGDEGRCGLSGLSLVWLNWIHRGGCLALLGCLAISIGHWGAERGTALALVAISLTAPLNLLVATRWPRQHLLSALLALVTATGAAIL